MSKKMQSLQQALSASAAKTAKHPEPPAAPAASHPPAPATRPRGRAGQVNISSWMDPNFKSSLRLVQARKGPKCELQDLIAEALNDLFVKYDVPTVSQD